MDILSFSNHSHDDQYSNEVCVHFYLNTCIFVSVDIILEWCLIAQVGH